MRSPLAGALICDTQVWGGGSGAAGRKWPYASGSWEGAGGDLRSPQNRCPAAGAGPGRKREGGPEHGFRWGLAGPGFLGGERGAEVALGGEKQRGGCSLVLCGTHLVAVWS